MLRDSLTRLRAWLAPLQADRIESREGVRALAALAGLCGQLQRYSEQIAAVREGLVSLDAIARGRPIASEPGASGYHDARVAAERDLAARREGGEPLADAFRQIAQPRNDIHHGGLNAQPLDAKALREQVERLSARFVAQAAEARGE